MSTVLRMYRGDDRTWSMTATGDGSAIDLTDASLRFTARETIGGDAVIALSSADGDITVTDEAAGEFDLTIPAADTASLVIPTTAYAAYRYYPWYAYFGRTREPNTYLRLLWDIEIVDAATNKRTWPEDANGRPRLGVLLISADVST